MDMFFHIAIVSLISILMSSSFFLSQGEKAREVFVKSKLPVEQLSQIWCVPFSFSQTI